MTGRAHAGPAAFGLDAVDPGGQRTQHDTGPGLDLDGLLAAVMLPVSHSRHQCAPLHSISPPAWFAGVNGKLKDAARGILTMSAVFSRRDRSEPCRSAPGPSPPDRGR